MKKAYFILTLILISCFNSFSQTWSFARSIGDYGNGEPKATTIDNLGEVILCGQYKDTLYLDGDTIPNAGGDDSYLIKMDTLGVTKWSIILSSAYVDRVDQVTVDDSNNIYLSATLSDTLIIQGVPIYPTGLNAFIFKFSPSGQLLWHIKANGTSSAQGVALDKQGYLYFSCLVNTTATIGPVVLNNSTGIYNTGILKCNRYTGQVLSGIMISSSGDYGVYGMVSDSVGQLFITGYNRPSSNPYGSFYMRRLNTSWSTGWNYEMVAPSSDCYGYDVDLDPYGNVYFTGYIYNNVTFNGGQFGTAGSYRQAVLTKFDTLGNLGWARSYGNSSPDIANSVACDDSGNVYWAGSFEDSIRIGNTTLIASNFAYADAFFVKLDSTGQVLWDNNISGTFNENPVELNFNKVSRSIAITGTHAAAAIFDTINVPNTRGQDAYVARFRMPKPYVSGVGILENKIESSIATVFNESNNLSILLHYFTSDSHYMIFDTNGRLIKKEMLSLGSNNIDISTYKSGLYIVNIISGKYSQSEKFLVAK